jgi:hypothetical protein
MQEKLICETTDGTNCILNEGFYVYFLPCMMSFLRETTGFYRELY